MEAAEAGWVGVPSVGAAPSSGCALSSLGGLSISIFQEVGQHLKGPYVIVYSLSLHSEQLVGKVGLGSRLFVPSILLSHARSSMLPVVEDCELT